MSKNWMDTECSKQGRYQMHMLHDISMKTRRKGNLNVDVRRR
jgi:hypothetical protein